ncbi:type IV toxin-antitoxin system AbiEi family antitoxin domain-containing protein [Sphingobium scionense]|uniref:type IV toxin-antitoxin system AbiEi family antitoxin domain-containing protein n=1 Tax=Sphingobium scionense TaxID=1404341 RepID=UPI0031B5DA54
MLFASDEARKTLSRFRALARRSSYPQSGEAGIFASDAPLLPIREPTGGIRKRERDRAERVRSEGSPKPSLKERAVAFARERGVIRTKDLTSIGIPRCYLSPMCDEGLLVRVGYGRYIVASQ